MEKIQKGLFTAIIAGESIHILCCFLPSLISIVNLLTSAGIALTLPGFIDAIHHTIHDYEVPMIITSAVLLIAGWGVYVYASRLNCATQNSTCCHGPCTPRKTLSKRIMVVATILFMFNVTIYTTFHYSEENKSDHVHIEHVD